MKKILFFCVVLILSVGYAGAQNNKKKNKEEVVEWNYEVETLSKNGHGAYVLKVWNLSEKPQVTLEQGKKNAVHSVIFNGVSQGQSGRIPGIRALLSSFGAEDIYADFFKSFFADGGDYKKFVSLSNSGFAEVVKIPKIKDKSGKSTSVFKYKIGQTMTVNVPALRRYLEEAGIIKPLSAGFR